jgi:hypothetical protein
MKLETLTIHPENERIYSPVPLTKHFETRDEISKNSFLIDTYQRNINI